MPGVAEENVVAWESGLAVYVLGGFGGAAQEVAAVMSGGRSNALTPDGFAANRKYHGLSKTALERGRADELGRMVAWLLKQLQCGDFDNSLSRGKTPVLWRTANVELAGALVSKSLGRIDPRQGMRSRLITPTSAGDPDRRRTGAPTPTFRTRSTLWKYQSIRVTNAGNDLRVARVRRS